MTSPSTMPSPNDRDRAQELLSTGGIASTARHWWEKRLPSYTKSMQALTLHAYRSGWKHLAKNELTSSGIDLYSAGIAFATTALLYIASNYYLTSWVESAYENYRPEFLKMVATQEDAKQAFTVAGWLDDSAAEKGLGTSNSTFTKPFYQWIEDIYFQFGVDSQSRQFKRRLREMVTGDRSGWLILTVRSTTGNQIYDELVRIEGPTGHMATTVGANSSKKRLFLAMTDEMLASVQQPLRWIYCIDGTIQFLTVLLSLFILTAIARRYLFVLRLAYHWLGPSAAEVLVSTESSGYNADRELATLVQRAQTASAEEQVELASAELERIRLEADRAVYDSYWFLAGILPSLGFIGTVVGMSAALLKADRLFVAADRQLAIADMTKELGLAFDTTLIALLMGLLVSVPLSTVRSRELTFYREFARRLSTRHQPSADPMVAEAVA